MDIRDMLADSELSLALFDQLREAMYVVDRERRIVFWNAAAEHITGYLRQDVAGRFCQGDILMHCDAQGSSLCGGRCPLSRVLEDGRPQESVVFLRHRHGHRVPVEVRAHPIHAGGGIVGAIELFEAAPAMARDQVLELDALGCLEPGTRALTRACGELRLRQQMLEIGAYGGAAGWLRVKLRDPGFFGQRFGHAAPDAAMALVARTVRGGLSSTDAVARWSEDEFRVLISRSGGERLRETAGLLQMLVHSSEFEWWGQPVCVEVAVDGTLVSVGDTLETIEARLQHK